LLLPNLAWGQTGNQAGNQAGNQTGTTGPKTNITPTPAGSQALYRLYNVGVQDTNAAYADANQSTLTIFIGNVIAVFLGLLGVVFLILMIVAGFNWMTAGGNEEKVSKAGHTIKVAIIGLLIVIGSFAIWRFVFERIILKQ